MTVKRLLEEVEDAHELTEWMAFANIEPLLGRRLDLVAGRIINLLLRVFGDSNPRPEDILPNWDDPTGQEALEASVINFARAFEHLRSPRNAAESPEGGNAPPAGPTRDRPARSQPGSKKGTHLRDPNADPKRKRG